MWLKGWTYGLRGGMENPSNVTMYIGDDELTWQPGRCHLVDDSYEHHIESKDTDSLRTILELKVPRK